MTSDELSALHKRLSKRARLLMERKNHDYTSGSDDPFENFRDSEVFGVEPGKGILLRMLDKMKRINTYIELDGVRKVDCDSLEDDVVDIMNYAVLLFGMLTEGDEQCESRS